jgi:hypothetical protein
MCTTLPQLDLFLLVQWVGDDPATRHPFAAFEAGRVLGVLYPD